MPRNQVSKTSDGRLAYSATDRNGQRIHLKQRVNETRDDFLTRCDALDTSVRKYGNSNLSMNELFQMWIEGHVEINLSPAEIRTTIPIYENRVRPYLGRRKISEIDRADVYQILIRAQKEGCSSSYIKKIRGCISRPYNWAINTLGFNIASPTQGLVFRMPKKDAQDESPVERVISDVDLERFLEVAQGTKYYNLYLILAGCGLRPSEGLGLQIKDIQNDRLLIRRGITIDGYSPLKTASSKRDIPLTDSLRTALSDQRSKVAFQTKEGWLFPCAGSTPSMNAVNLSFKRVMRQANKLDSDSAVINTPLSLTLYDFRHTFATRMAEAGMPPKTLQAILGHSDISTSLTYYVSVTDKMLDQARDLMQAL